MQKAIPSTDIQPDSLLLRAAHSAFGGGLGALIVVGFEAWSASMRGVGLAAAASAYVGLLLLPSVLMGACVGLLSYPLQARRRLGIVGGLVRWRTLTSEAAGVCAGFVLGVPLALVLLSQASLRLMVAPVAPHVAAAGLSFSALLILVTVLASACALGRSLATGVLSRWSPRVLLAVAILLGLAWFGLLVNFGATSGAEGTWSILGVLRREELDLRGPWYLGLLLILAYQLPAWLLKSHWWPSAMLLSVAVGSLVYSATAAFDSVELRNATERATALVRPVANWGSRLGDSDKDGFSRWFGGGDCDDTDAAIRPDALDEPDNGIDEDCSGADEPRVIVEPSAPPPAAKLPKERLPEKLNVILVTIDTLRFDLGYMGYERPISPNIDALAKKAIVYERAYALASYTSKSLAPMMIGRYPSETNRGFRHFNIYPKSEKFVQERLGAEGIRSASVQAHWYFKANTGLGRGFDILDLSASPRVPQGEGDRSVSSERLTDAGISRFQELASGAQQFFLWVHYLDPHAEYVPHEQFSFGKSQRDLYDGEVAFTDHHVGRLLAAVENSPRAQDTAIILTSDHGEAFGEHGMVRHGFELWEELIRVPLLIYVPGLTPRRFAARRSLIDIVPTMLQLLGVERPPADKSGDFLSGRSLSPDWFLPATVQPERRAVFVDMPAGPYVGDRQALIENDIKIITSRSRPMGIYDLAKDPGEKRSLLKDKELALATHRRFKQFRGGLKTIRVKKR